MQVFAYGVGKHLAISLNLRAHVRVNYYTITTSLGYVYNAIYTHHDHDRTTKSTLLIPLPKTL